MHHSFCRLSIFLATLFAALPVQAERLYQYSTLDALLAGVYDGNLTLGEALNEGDFGLGTFNQLDGELILFEGIVYRAAYNGTVAVVEESQRTPFIAVTHFESEDAFELVADLQDLSYSELKTTLDQAIPSENLFYAIQVEGTFNSLKYRSVPAQVKPYPPLAVVVKEQSVFEVENATGVLVGFRCPAYSSGINVPGYHFHFLSEDRKSGGHVLEMKTGPITVSILTLESWEVDLPDTEPFLTLPLEKNPNADLDHVEKDS